MIIYFKPAVKLKSFDKLKETVKNGFELVFERKVITETTSSTEYNTY